MIAQSQTLDALLAQIASMSTSEDSDRVRDAIRHFEEHASDADYQMVRQALSKRLNEILDAGMLEMQQTTDLLRLDGITYDPGEWLTIPNYAKKYGIDTHTVTDWIRRRVIPTDCVVELPVLNNIRMVKDQPYVQVG